MFAEDLTVFFDPDGLGTAATYGATTVNGIFERESVGPFEGMVADTGPRFTCAFADVPGLVQDTSSLVIGGITFRVVGVEPDGTGLVTLRLQQP